MVMDMCFRTARLSYATTHSGQLSRSVGPSACWALSAGEVEDRPCLQEATDELEGKF